MVLNILSPEKEFAKKDRAQPMAFQNPIKTPVFA
jgi:hypothetical protein